MAQITNDIRCLKGKEFFELMTQEKSNDNAHTIQEQISTENLVKNSYESFIHLYQDDPEYFFLNFLNVK